MPLPVRIAFADRLTTQGFHDSLAARVRVEYDEMPGLCLTPQQVQRLCGLGHEEAQAALGALVQSGYLRHTARGFIRV